MLLPTLLTFTPYKFINFAADEHCVYNIYKTMVFNKLKCS